MEKPDNQALAPYIAVGKALALLLLDLPEEQSVEICKDTEGLCIYLKEQGAVIESMYIESSCTLPMLANLFDNLRTSIPTTHPAIDLGAIDRLVSKHEGQQGDE